jgi:hypothetical protein
LKPTAPSYGQNQQKEVRTMEIPKSLKMIRVATAKEEQDALDFMMNEMDSVLSGERALSLQNHELMAKQSDMKRSIIEERIRRYEKNVANHTASNLRLRIRVVAGSCLPKPGGKKSGEYIDPYVTVTLHDVKEKDEGKATYVSASFTTNTVSDNGFYAVWDDKAMKEFTVVSPSVAMLQFSVKDSDIGVGLDEHIADVAIPCNRLRSGYRSVQLYDKYNSRSGAFGFAKLLVQIEIS